MSLRLVTRSVWNNPGNSGRRLRTFAVAGRQIRSASEARDRPSQLDGSGTPDFARRTSRNLFAAPEELLPQQAGGAR